MNLSAEEQEEIARGQSANIEAREAFQKGWEHYFRFTSAANAEAAELFKIAVELDPEYGRAYSALGMVYVRGCQWRWNADLGMTAEQANIAAESYLSEGEARSSSLTNVAASQIHLYNERHDEAFTEASRAVALDPNNPEGYVAMALAMITTGRPEAGLEFVQTALRLNPNRPNHYAMAHGMAYFAMDDLQQAAAILQDALDRDPDAVELAPILAATYANLGRREDARTMLQKWRPDDSEAELDSTVWSYHFPYPFAVDESGVETRLNDGLKIAGLPSDVTVESLVDALEHGNVRERDRAALTLGWFGPNAAEAVPTLIDALTDENRGLQIRAAYALGKIGPAAAAAIPALTAMQDDENFGVQVKEALKDIRGP